MPKEVGGSDIKSEAVEWLAKRATYRSGDFNDSGLFDSLKDVIGKIEPDQTGGNRIFYLAVAPSFILSITTKLSQAGLLNEAGKRWSRLVIEKPFGHDVDSAKAICLGRRFRIQLSFPKR